MKTKTLRRTGWLRAVAECFPRLKLEGLLTLKGKIDGLGAGGSWLGGIGNGAGFKRLGLKYFGGAEDFASWAGNAARVLALDQKEYPTPPPEGFPWLELHWDAESGAVESAAILGGPERKAGSSRAWRFSHGEKALLSRAPFSAGLFAELGLEEAFRQFDSLCPVSGLISESAMDAAGRLTPRHAWSLQLKKAIAWPLLLRLDVAAPLAGMSSQLSFILLDREVAEIGFTKDSLWAWFLN